MKIDNDLDCKRLDTYISEINPEISRNKAQKMIEKGDITINDKAVKKNYVLRLNDVIDIIYQEPERIEIVAENIPINIVYEDDDIIVINKERGMVVHPAIGNWNGTLVNALMYHCNLSGKDEVRPGIVHRIDKDTSGLLVVAKNEMAHNHLSNQLKEYKAARIYEAIVLGKLEDGTVNKPIGRHHLDRKKMAVTDKHSREAITHYELIEQYPGFSHMKFTLETGRTHQIRVHMQSIGHPILGDEVYNPHKNKFGFKGQCLHAKKLEFIHPKTQEKMTFEIELPEYFKEILSKLQ